MILYLEIKLRYEVNEGRKRSDELCESGPVSLGIYQAVGPSVNLT